MNWAWYLLSENPETERKLHQEILAVVPDGSMSFQRASRLQYARQILQETLRLYPAGWLLTRRALAEDEISGFRVPAGTDIFVAPYIVHRHSRYWSRPEQFDPDRFREGGKHINHRSVFIPFSVGSRRCIGEHLSFLEMLTHLGVLAGRYRLHHVDDKPIELDFAVNLRTKYDLQMAITART